MMGGMGGGSGGGRDRGLADVMNGGGRGGSREKVKVPTGYVLRRLWRYLGRTRGLLAVALVLAVVSNLLAMLGPLVSGYAIDAIGTELGGADLPLVVRYALMMLVLYAVSSVLSYILAVLMVRISQRVVVHLRGDVFDHLATLPVSFFDRHAVGEVVSTISYDINTINTSLSHDLLQILVSVMTVVGSLAIMISISPRLVLVFAVTIPISMVFARYRAKKIRPLFSRRSARLAALNGFSEEMMGGLKTMRAYHREEEMLERFDRFNREAADAYYEADYQGSITGPTVMFISNLSLALVSIFGALLYMAGSLSLGNISSFVLYSRKFSGPINEFANLIAELQSAFAAAGRVFRLLDEEPERPDTPDARVLESGSVQGAVDFCGIGFGYDPGRPIIQDFSLHVEPGSTVAIVGPTGAGKTTIINLLMRFYDVDSGAIRLDGVDLRDIRRDSLRSQFTMVLQDTWLFHGTIAENIAYGNEAVTREDVERVAKQARIDRTIRAMPAGYDTVLVDNGANISRGQKQLITIARAMLLDSKILILDEATSNVDTATERRIQRAMLNLMEGRTSVVIAHRLSTVQHAQLILVLDGGRVVEHGSHESLIAQGGLYRQLYESQFVVQ